MYQYLNRAKDEDSVEALDVGVGKEGCWDGEHLQRGEEVARHRGGPRDVGVPVREGPLRGAAGGAVPARRGEGGGAAGADAGADGVAVHAGGRRQPADVQAGEGAAEHDPPALRDGRRAAGGVRAGGRRARRSRAIAAGPRQDVP